jgi:hypothetical protein
VDEESTPKQVKLFESSSAQKDLSKDALISMLVIPKFFLGELSNRCEK